MAAQPVTRHFLELSNRRVHYFRAGEGPPAVLIHPSPANARLLMKEMKRLSGEHTVFAFDTPGFGLSDALALETMEVADLADALAETLAAIGMPRCPIFGSHTGAAIALEFGVRHPERVTGLVLDGVPAFTDTECERYFRDYFRPIPLDDLGGHYSATWTRFRDQAIWFPWCEREPDTSIPTISPPHSTHLWVSMYFEAADSYEPAYRAASFYGAKAIAAAAALTVPAVYTAAETDMLYPHLERLPAMKADQSIVRIGNSFERKRALIAECFAHYGADGTAPKDHDEIGSRDSLGRQFVHGSAGVLHLRWRGDRTARPLLLIHDAPGSSEQIAPMIDALSETFFVVAPDLPGSGESDAFGAQPDIAQFALEMVALLDRLGLPQVAVMGFGFGSSVALELARLAPARIIIAGLCGLLLPDADERAPLAAHYTPPIAIEADGAHWYRTWLMLRDSQIYWPWFDRTVVAQRRVEADFGACRLHNWTMDVMRARASYHHLIQAGLAHDAEAALSLAPVPIVPVRDARRPLSVYDARLAALRPDTPMIATEDLAALVRALGPG